MSRLSSLLSMPGAQLLFCAAILANRVVHGTRPTDSSSMQDWLVEVTRMPGKYFMSVSDKFIKQKEGEVEYYEYGVNDYDYDDGFIRRTLVQDNRARDKLPEHPSVPCVDGSPCPNVTDAQHEKSQPSRQQDGNDISTNSTPTSEIDENEPSLPEQNAPCVGGAPCANSTESEEDIDRISQQQEDDADYSPRATLEEAPVDKSAPTKKTPCTGGSSCPSARISREDMEKSVYERVRINILKQLNMKEPPNVSASDVDLSSPPIQRILRKHGIKDQRHLDQELVKDESGEDMTTKETVISSAKPSLFPELPGMHFTFSEDDTTYSVKTAVLWLHVKGHPGRTANATLEFFRYQEARNGSLIAKKFDKKKIKVHQRGMWRKFMITNEVTRWFINSSSNYGIDIRCPEFPDIISGVDVNIKKPVLEVQVEHSQLSRRRRRSTMDNCGSTNNNCCRHNLTISFRNLGWSWVIAPLEFQSYHCYGDCVFLQQSRNYQRLQYLTHASPSKSCCSPTKMLPIKLLYFDNDQNVIYSQIDDMIVQKCGCV